MATLLPAEFERLAATTMHNRRGMTQREFLAKFGSSAYIISKVWAYLVRDGLLPDSATPTHLLWAMAFLKVYSTETTMAGMFHTSVQTYRNWVWKMVEAIYYIDLIKWENRLMKDNGSVCKLTVDGIDFRIREPIPFNKKWYSHKSHGAALRYEVGVCIQTGWICWVNGPYAAGAWPDLRISRDALIYKLGRVEKVQADGGYGGAYHEKPDKGKLGSPRERMKATARARHETVNGKFTCFHCLKDIWRHPRQKHGIVFGAVANIVQLQIRYEKAVFQVYYDDNRVR